MNNSFFNKFKSISFPTNQFFLLASFLVLIMFFAFAILGSDGLLRLLELKNLRDQIAQENKDMLLQNLANTQEILSMKKTTSIEQVARSELGMIRQDEVVLIFSKEKPVNKN